MEILLDTNILRRDWLLESVDFQSLIEYSFKTMSPIALSKLVIDELGLLYESELIKTIRSVQSKTSELNRMMFDREYPLPENFDFKELSVNYKAYVKSKLGKYYLIEIPVKPEYWVNAGERWLNCIKPFSKGRDAFRDTVIWLSLLGHLRDNQHEEFVFITDNYKDFGNQEGSDLHPDLRAEAGNLNLTFCRSLRDFCKQYAKHTNFINEEWLVMNIDWDRLDSNALAGVSSIHCAFFFEDCRRRLSHVDIKSWEVQQARYHKSVEMFFVSCMPENAYSVWLLLEGSTLIRYFSGGGEIYPLDSYFVAEVTIEIRDGKITNYQDCYYQENTGLVLSSEAELKYL